ncbi:MAG: PQQ-dependent sugar dehydrogenase [Gammaproteobacteria bacterium]
MTPFRRAKWLLAGSSAGAGQRDPWPGSVAGFRRRHLWLTAGLMLLLAAAFAARAELNQDASAAKQAAGEPASDWKKNWAVDEGFALSMDTQGYDFPTAIAFVPKPGPDPKDPLYFVTELRGKVKVVTNDRTVHTFAEDFLQTGFGEELNYQTESGVGGICVAPKQGYVFVTFAYQDGENLRNNIIRFETTPGTFALKPKSQTAFTEVFAPYESGVSHQIGGCAISNGMLYVGVGDGWNSHLGAQRLNTFQGKVIRMTLDGEPAPDNPFYENDDIGRAANYIWAYGFRNPFSLNVIDERVMVAENGVNADRFLNVERGKNYLWNGGDRSISANADYVFLESVGPAQMGFLEPASHLFPQRFRGQFYLALSSKTPETAGVVRMAYGFQEGRMTAVPEYVLQAAQDAYNPLTGLAFGPDGLYFAPILPLANGRSAVLKLEYEPRNAHPITLRDLIEAEVSVADGESIMARRGCFGCHKVQGVPGRGGTKGPVLGDDAMVRRVEQRVNSEAFLESLQELDARDEAPFNRFEQARDRLAEAQGLERVRLYVKYQILEPRFDGPASAMPNLGLTEGEADAITGFLLGEADKGFVDKLKERLFRNEQRRLALAFVAGLCVGLPVWFALSRLARLVSRRRV